MVCASLSHTNARPYALSMLFSLMLISLVYVTHAACNIWASNLGVGCRHASVSALNAMQGLIYIYIYIGLVIGAGGWLRMKVGKNIKCCMGCAFGMVLWIWVAAMGVVPVDLARGCLGANPPLGFRNCPTGAGLWPKTRSCETLWPSEIAPQAPDFPKLYPVGHFGLPKLPHRCQTAHCLLDFWSLWECFLANFASKVDSWEAQKP